MIEKALILLAEDEQTDAYFIQWANKKAGLPHEIFHVADGQEAIDYLRGTPPYDDRTRHPFPHLLLLDLKMPRLTGFDVLSWLKQDSDFPELPVVVLSSSNYPADIDQARKLGATDYKIKPGNPQLLVEMLQELDQRWFRPLPREDSLSLKRS
jgi:CheY-like chemotaxis protein